MKRIKIAAIGAMLLLGIACSKDNNQYEPSDLTVTNKASTTKDALNTPVQNSANQGGLTNDGVRKDYDLPTPVVTPTLVADPATTDPGNPPIVIGVGNTVQDPATNTNRIRMDVINDDDVTPSTDPR
jgi:hypothetical protein